MEDSTDCPFAEKCEGQREVDKPSDDSPFRYTVTARHSDVSEEKVKEEKKREEERRKREKEREKAKCIFLCSEKKKRNLAMVWLFLR